MHIAISININNILYGGAHWLRVNFNNSCYTLAPFTPYVNANNVELLGSIASTRFIFWFLQYSVPIKSVAVEERVINNSTPLAFQISYDDPQSHPL